MLLSLRSNLLDTKVYIQKSDGLCTGCFHHMIKTHTWWELSLVIAAVRLILEYNILICLYLYEYLLLWDIPYIVGNSLMSAFQCKFDCVNPSSHLWDISRQNFYSCWWHDISVVCCHFCTSCIFADSPHSGLSSAT